MSFGVSQQVACSDLVLWAWLTANWFTHVDFRLESSLKWWCNDCLVVCSLVLVSWLAFGLSLILLGC